ncbi:MAG: metal-dependent transcriptional regulator [Acidimicrobiia bacterium]|nr:metal-dependent transcriptional regulator [Acidimicrobiia bacterium]
MNADLTKSERETLKAVYRTTKDGGEAHTGVLADTLGVSPATITSHVKRLADRGLLSHRPYHGVRLTDDGRRSAVALIRRHRIVERFLSDMLGYAWNQADALAPTFEHDLPDEVVERLFRALNRPTTCPHGFPIPDRGQSEVPELPQLYDLEPGDVAEVAVPGATDPEVVSFLEELGLVPDAHVLVREKHPFDGPLVLDVDGHDRTLGEKVARQVYVQRVARREVPVTGGAGDGGAAPGTTDAIDEIDASAATDELDHDRGDEATTGRGQRT